MNTPEQITGLAAELAQADYPEVTAIDHSANAAGTVPASPAAIAALIEGMQAAETEAVTPEFELEVAQRWMDLSVTLYPDYPLEADMTPEQMVQAVKNTSVHVAFQTLMLAEDDNNAICFFRSNEGQSGLLKMPSQALVAAIENFADQLKEDDERLLLVRVVINTDGGLPPADGVFISSAQNLNSLVGRRVYVNEQAITLTDEHFVVLSDDDCLVNELLENYDTGNDDGAGDLATSISGFNPFAKLLLTVPDVSPADSEGGEL